MSETKNQFAGTLLLILTVAAVFSAILCFRQLLTYQLPDDGVIWADKGKDSVVAVYIEPDGPLDHHGIRPGDGLVKIQNFPIRRALNVPQALSEISLYSSTRYTLIRNGIEFQVAGIFPRAAPRDSALYYQFLVGFFYLASGFSFTTAAPAPPRACIFSSSAWSLSSPRVSTTPAQTQRL